MAAVVILISIRPHLVALLIGTVVKDDARLVVLKTTVGGRRIVDMLPGEQLPRIC